MKPVYFLVLSLLVGLAGCSHKAKDDFNDKALLPSGLPFDPLQWRVISSAVDKGDSTMSTLYGNDLAVNHARSTAMHAYPAGSVLALVTWFQQDDKHWFGAEIPAQVKSIEFVQIQATPDGKASTMYEAFEGSPLARVAPDAITFTARTDYILNEKASVMP
jgi:hypothetical protein